MKYLILFAIFLPVLSFAQKFELSEQAGYSIVDANDIHQKSGPSNQIAITYHPFKHFALSASYELNSWSSINNSFGIVPDLTSKYFFIGWDLKMAMINTFKPDNNYSIKQLKYDPSFGCGAHIGTKQKINKRLSIIEQTGYELLFINGKAKYLFIPTTVELSSPYTSIPTVNAYDTHSFSSTLKYFYLRVGLSYRL